MPTPSALRTLPAVVLVTTVIAAVALRARHGAEVRATLPRASLAASPTTPPETLPPVRDVATDRPVTAGGPRMLHGDARHTHRAHGHLPRAPEVAWTFHTDGPVEGQPVVSPDENTLYVATLGGSLYALSRDGQLGFRLPLGGRSYATPSVGPDGTVYVGVDGGALLAVRDGTIAWRLETDGDADTGATLLPGGLVVFGAGSNVYGVRPDGALLFRSRTRGKVFTAPALMTTATGEPRIVFGAQDHHVSALDARGAVVWSVDVGRDVDASPVVGEDGSIFVGTDGDEVIRVSPGGQIAWRTRVGGYVRGALSMARNGDVLAGVYGPNPRLVRLDETGVIRGAFPIRGNGQPEVGVQGGALEDDDGALLFGGQDGRVHAIGADATERWAYDAHADVDAPVTLLGDGTAIVGTYDGDVIALRDTAR